MTAIIITAYIAGALSGGAIVAGICGFAFLALNNEKDWDK